MTLYRYVPSNAYLLAAMTDAALETHVPLSRFRMWHVSTANMVGILWAAAMFA